MKKREYIEYLETLKNINKKTTELQFFIKEIESYKYNGSTKSILNEFASELKDIKKEIMNLQSKQEEIKTTIKKRHFLAEHLAVLNSRVIEFNAVCDELMDACGIGSKKQKYKTATCAAAILNTMFLVAGGLNAIVNSNYILLNCAVGSTVASTAYLALELKNINQKFDEVVKNIRYDYFKEDTELGKKEIELMNKNIETAKAATRPAATKGYTSKKVFTNKVLLNNKDLIDATLAHTNEDLQK